MSVPLYSVTRGQAAAANRPTFCNVIYARQLHITIGQFIANLELIALASEPAEWLNRVVYLSLK